MNESQPSWTPPPVAKTAGMATTSLVLGVLSFVCFGPLTGIPAIICGHMARNKIRHSGGTLTGEGMALAGLITGYVNLALMIFLIPLLAAIAIPNFVKARTTAQKNACISHLRQIDGAKEQWALENKKEPGDEVTLSELVGPGKYIQNTIYRGADW
jgi:competence protein ComGC